ncbi:MAG: peptidoglycan bridge formation glycyltransferase FemA/FemB family protein [Nanoarchaeota archaeon]|nr:peptidoglycan bridge formation glycyltransferase FemA/FemB family protein [Nanoarchaeota archaeon]
MKDKNATIIVDLIPSLDEIKKNLHKDARWGIGKAEKEGLKVEQTDREEDWKEFYEIYKNTMKEGGIMPSSLEKLKENTSTFLVCKKEGRIIAGAGIWFRNVYSKEIPRLYFNASLKDFQSLQPNNLLYWSCIVWSKEKNYKEFDLGGWQINAREHLQGVNKFKEKWGSVVYFEKEYPLFKAIGRKLVRKFYLIKKINQRFRRNKDAQK